MRTVDVIKRMFSNRQLHSMCTAMTLSISRLIACKIQSVSSVLVVLNPFKICKVLCIKGLITAFTNFNHDLTYSYFSEVHIHTLLP
jgi:hypothetical protein